MKSAHAVRSADAVASTGTCTGASQKDKYKHTYNQKYRYTKRYMHKKPYR